MVGIGAFRVFKRTRLNIEPYSQLKPTMVGFISLGLTSLVEPKILQLSITWHKLSSEFRQRSGLKVGFKELRLEPKFLNRGLRTIIILISFFNNLNLVNFVKLGAPPGPLLQSPIMMINLMNRPTVELDYTLIYPLQLSSAGPGLSGRFNWINSCILGRFIG